MNKSTIIKLAVAASLIAVAVVVGKKYITKVTEKITAKIMEGESEQA